MSQKKVEKCVQNCYSSWSDNYYDNYYSEKADYPPVHVPLLKKIIKKNKVTRLLDAGCGPASLLRELFRLKIDLYGFDLTNEMVEEAKNIFVTSKRSADHIWKGSVLSPSSFKVPGKKKVYFDAVLCSGVLPHIEEKNDIKVIKNLKNAVKKNGLVVLEARNELFSLFTANRYSYDYFVEKLIQPNKLSKGNASKNKKLTKVLNEFKKQFRMDLPPLRRGQSTLGYDEVLSRTHNPLVLKKQFESQGFKDVKLYFYHYHALPPMLEKQFPELFKEWSLSMEDPEDWRGHFMASAFLLTGIK